MDPFDDTISDSLHSWILSQIESFSSSHQQERLRQWRPMPLGNGFKNISSPIRLVLSPTTRAPPCLAMKCFRKSNHFGERNAADTQAERSNLLQQLHDTAPWPQNPRSPVLRPIRGIDLKNKAMNMTSKAVGPDQWSAQEIVHFPDQLLELYAEFFNKLETHGQWPKALLQWRQVLIPKPGKDTGIAKDLRPISIGSIWYRIYSSIRITQYSNWVERAGPEFHGGLRHRGTATALLGPLCAWQRTQNDDISPGVRRRIIARQRLIRYTGASDLSKAFDRLHGTLAGQALQRMGYPPDVVRAWQSAWHGQERFLQLGNQTSQNPVGEIFCLPQGDPASPMGLLAPLAEAMKRLQEAHKTFGDVSWMTAAGGAAR